MNIHSRDVDKEIQRSEAQAALDVLRSFVAEKGAEALDGPHLTALRGLLPAAYPELSRDFPENFVADAAYRATLPDLQNGPSSLIRGEIASFNMLAFQTFDCQSALQQKQVARLRLKLR